MSAVRFKGDFESLAWDVKPRRSSSISLSSRLFLRMGSGSRGDDEELRFFERGMVSFNSCRFGRGAKEFCEPEVWFFLLGDLTGDRLDESLGLGLGDNMNSLTGKNIPLDLRSGVLSPV